jgi:hypothetical protein
LPCPEETAVPGADPTADEVLEADLADLAVDREPEGELDDELVSEEEEPDVDSDVVDEELAVAADVGESSACAPYLARQMSCLVARTPGV